MLRAARLGELEAVRAGLKAKFPPSKSGMDGETALHEAAKFDRLDVATLLLAHNADPNVDSNVSARPLRLAAQKGHAEMVQLLVDNGADPLEVSMNGNTAKTDAKTKECAKILQEAEQAWRVKHAAL